MHPTRHTIALRPSKCYAIISATLWLLTLWKPSFSAVQRVVGKIGYGQTFRTSTRSAFGATFGWMEAMREAKATRVALPRVVRAELLEAALLLPLATMNLGAEWSGKVTMSDAAPGGHGKTAASVPPALVQRWARFAEFRGDHTHLTEDLDLDPGVVKRPVFKADPPWQDYWWTEVARPGGFQNIALEEWDAVLWSAEDRLRTGREAGCRYLHAGDNTVQVCSAAKGRSSNAAINKRCRRANAIALAGDLTPFILYVPTHRNTADRPSRIFAGDVRLSLGFVPRPMAELPSWWW